MLLDWVRAFNERDAAADRRPSLDFSPDMLPADLDGYTAENVIDHLLNNC